MRKLVAHIPAFSRFALVGATTAALYFGVFALLHDMLGVAYQIAVSCGYACGVAFHFFANRNITFKDAEGHISRQLVKYAVVAGINYGITLIIVGLTVEILHRSPYLGVLAAVATTTLVGYVLFDTWVFRRREGPVG
jgi:putative flippase GtrA